MNDNDLTDLSKRELLQLLQDKQRKIDSLETACAGYEKIITELKEQLGM